MKVPSTREPTDDLWQAIHSQRAIRYWQDRPVPRELIERIVEAASKAPSGQNSQPWVFVVVDDEAKRRAIGDAVRTFFEQAEPVRQLIEEGRRADDKSERLMYEGTVNFFTRLASAPVLIVPCLHGLHSPTDDPTSLLAGSSIYGAVQNLMLAARGLGLGTLMATAHDLIEPQLREILALPDDAWPVAMIPVGWPDANFGPTKRKPVAEILRWNGWG